MYSNLLSNFYIGAGSLFEGANNIASESDSEITRLTLPLSLITNTNNGDTVACSKYRTSSWLHRRPSILRAWWTSLTEAAIVKRKGRPELEIDGRQAPSRLTIATHLTISVPISSTSLSFKLVQLTLPSVHMALYARYNTSSSFLLNKMLTMNNHSHSVSHSSHYPRTDCAHSLLTTLCHIRTAIWWTAR